MPIFKYILASKDEYGKITLALGLLSLWLLILRISPKIYLNKFIALDILSIFTNIKDK